MTYRLEAKLRGYIHGVFPTKLSELENDVPYVSAADGQELTDGQKRAALENVNATEILAENFVRHDVATELSEEAQQTARDNIGTYGKAEIDERIGNIKIDFLDDANKYTDQQVDALAKRTASSIDELRENTAQSLRDIHKDINDIQQDIGDAEYVGFDETPATVKDAINMLASRPSVPAVDDSTIVLVDIEGEQTLKAKAIQDMTSDGERVISPQTIVNLEQATAKISKEVERLQGRGGYLTPFDFGWDGVSDSVQVGDTFNESRNGVKTEITVVADGSGNYPTGTNINLTDAYKKAVDWQIDLMDWATFDIWGAINRKYGTEGLDEVAEGQRVTLSVKSITAQTEPFCEIFGTDADGNSYGVYQQDGKFYFGSFTYDTDLQTVTAVESDELWDGVSALKPFRKDYSAPKGIVLNASIERPFGGDSGLAWEENLIVWGKDFYEIFNGTRVINEFNNWEMELTNTQDTEPPVCSWATASIDQVINYADDDTGGIVRTGQTTGEGASRVYGVQLDDITKQMYVSELGEDLAEITQDVKDKVEKATGAVENNIAVFDSNGGIKDNNIKASDFATAAQGALADSAYQKPSTGIPATDLAQGVQDSLALADSALQSVPDATATQKGVATLGAAGGAARYGQKNDVGLGNVANVLQYSTENPPPYPVTSVAGKTGAVTLGKADVGLGNVDNTSDADKPISTATQAALNTKIGNTGSQSITGDLTIVKSGNNSGNMVVQGDLTVQGTTITTEAESLIVHDNLIVTNSEGASLTDLSGLAIKTDADNAYGIVYDPTTQSVKLGAGTLSAENELTFNEGEGAAVATRANSSELTDGHLLQWDATSHTLVDGGKMPETLPNPAALTIGQETYDGSVARSVTPEKIGAEPAFAKNTAFNKNFGTSAGTVAQGNDSRIVGAVQSAMFSGVAFEKSGTQLSISKESARTALGLGTAAYTNASDYATATQGARADEAYQTANEAKSIAEGRSQAKVFDDEGAMEAWLAVPSNTETLNVGDSLLIRAVDSPDYWWDGTSAQELETEKVDLTDYYTKAEVDVALGDKIESVSLKAGAANGQLVLTVDGQDANLVSVPGLGSAAYTESSAYATSAQGQKADDLGAKQVIGEDSTQSLADVTEPLATQSYVLATVGSGEGVQSVQLQSGTNNGTLKLLVNGVATDNIAVTGLASAAYTSSDDFATAAQGALADSAYQKPSGGIPNTDLAQGVQDSLGLADSALQGITAGNNITIDTSDPKHPVISSTGGISEIEPLTIQLNGTDGVVFDGSEAQSVNITAAGIGAEPTIATKRTAFNKDFGTTAGTVMEGNDSRVTGAVQSVTFAGKELTKTEGAAEITQSEARTALGLGSAAYTASTAYATSAQGTLADSAYQKPSTGIPATDLAEGVQDSLALADSALQSVPDATATQKGVATLGAAGGAARYGQKNDVGLGNVDNVKQYSASNPPPYPVTSVAGRTGAVTLTKADVELNNVANERQYSANNPPPYPVTSVAGKTGVVTLEKADVGLGNVDNTSDLDKPVSTATQTALNTKIGNTGAQSIAGNLTLVADSGGNGNLVVQGDLTVQGTTITEEHETLNVVDNLIVTNSEGASLTDLSGVAIRKNATDTYGLLYDPVSDSVKLGLGTIDAEGDFAFNPGEGKPVTIRDDSANLTDGHLLEWDSTENKVVDGGAKPTALPNPHALTLGSKVYNGSSDVTLLASDIDAEPAFAKNTAFNKNFGTTADTVAQGNDSRITGAVQSAMFSGVAFEKSGTQLSISQESARTALGLGTAAYTNVGDNVVDVGAVAGLPVPATGQVYLTVSEEIANRIRDNEDSIIKVRLLLPESTSEGTVIYLRRNTNMWVDVSQDMDIWSCMIDASMYEGHEVVAISYMAAFNPSSDVPTLGIQAVEIRNGAKVVDIGQISLSFMETGDVSVNITDEQYDALEDVDRTILKFSTSDGQNIYLNSFCLGSGIIYSAMIAEGGIVAAYTASIGGSSQKTVAIRASAVYGSTEGNIATVIDIGTVANFSFMEEGNWTVNISDEMYSKITAPSQETTQIKIADESGNVAYLTRYVDTDGSPIFVSTYTDASQVTLIQLFADVRGSAGSYKIEISCTMHLLGPHPQFINIGVVQGFEVGVEGSWNVNIPDNIYNKIAEGEDVRLVISDTNDVSVIMPQVQTIQGKKGFGTSLVLDQNGGRIEYAAGTSGVQGDYQLEIVAVVPDVGGGGGVEIIDLGTPTFQEANGGQYLLANLTLTSEQVAKLKTEPAPVVKFTLSGANGDYQNGAYYLTKTYLMGVDLHMYNTCFQVQDNGGWAITLQTTGATAAIITIYPYKIPQEVEANPSDSTDVTLEKLKVGGVTYAIPQGGGTAEVTKEAIATALNLSTTQLDVLVSLAQKVTITGDDVKFATGTVLKSSSFDAVD